MPTAVMHCGVPECTPLTAGFWWTWAGGSLGSAFGLCFRSHSLGHTHLAWASSWVAGGQRLKSARVEGELELLGPGPRVTPMD